ncbi:TIGR04104 family putative zinc finger protein [Paenibacillus wynnii]
MQQCLNCDKKFKYKQIMRSSMYGYKPIVCSHCGETHAVTLDSRIRIAIVIVAFPMVATQFIWGNFKYERVLFYILTIIPLVFMVPFLMKYRKKEQG